MYDSRSYWEIMDSILESISGVVVTDVEGCVVYINKFYADILKVNPQEVIGKPVREIIPRTRMDIVARTGKEEMGSVFVLKNGETIIVNRIPIKREGKVIGAVAFSVLSTRNEVNTVSTIEQVNRLNFELSQYKHELVKLRGAKYSLDQIIGSAPEIKKVRDHIKKVAQTKSTVLITGETGTGKELIAHSIHQLSMRSHNPFIRLNCAAIPRDLLESELFGYEEGAFTGAKKGGKPGKFELSHGGTLLLDEINQLPLYLQSKLLRAIQEKEVERVGGQRSVDIDLRLICISNQNLLELVERGEFREDLYYRINVVPISVPPLRERAEDIPQLVKHLIKKINRDVGLNISGVGHEVMDLFKKYHWPGNIRELEHVLERAANMVLSGHLGMKQFEFFIPRVYKESINTAAGGKTRLEDAKARAEKGAIIEALAKAGGNKKRASEMLEIDRSALYDKIKKYGIMVAKN